MLQNSHLLCLLPVASTQALPGPLRAPPRSHCVPLIDIASPFITPDIPALHTKFPDKCKCVAERSRERKVPTAAAPHFATTDKAEAWQKLTDLQQHMVGLITAVEDQLSLADSPNSPRGLRAGNSAERTAEAALSAVGTAQQQEWAAPPRGTPQAHEQPEIHLSGLKTDCDDPGGKAACSEAEDAAPAVEDAVAAATAAGHAAAACSTQKVSFTHTPC